VIQPPSSLHHYRFLLFRLVGTVTFFAFSDGLDRAAVVVFFLCSCLQEGELEFLSFPDLESTFLVLVSPTLNAISPPLL